MPGVAATPERLCCDMPQIESTLKELYQMRPLKEEQFPALIV
jgi:hypothetical protein